MNRKVYTLLFLVTICIVSLFVRSCVMHRETVYFRYDIPPELPQAYQPSHNATTEAGVALGKTLFFSTELSRNNTISCSSCHDQEKAFAESRTTSEGIDGQKVNRNSMPLFNLAWVDRFFWDGRAASLEEAVNFPITAHNEMDSDTNRLVQRLNRSARFRRQFYAAFGIEEVRYVHVRMALAQYLRSITSYASPLDRMYPIVSELMAQGLSQPQIMQREFGFSDKTIQTLQLCETCHSNITYGNNKMKNNGLDLSNAGDIGFAVVSGKKTDEGLFKAPSFRNVAFSGPYMHDGRFATLEEVLEHYNSGIQPNPNLSEELRDEAGNPVRLDLGEREKKEILFFLTRLMSDTSFITNKQYAL